MRSCSPITLVRLGFCWLKHYIGPDLVFSSTLIHFTLQSFLSILLLDVLECRFLIEFHTIPTQVQQALSLSKRPHVIVASPGRLVHHLENTKGFNLKNVQYLVLDEADRLLSDDFGDALDVIASQANKMHRRTFLFSATMTSKVAKLQKAALRNPVKVEISGKYDTAKGLTQNLLFVPEKYKMAACVAVCKQYEHMSIIIFVDMCSTASKLTAVLAKLNFKAVALHGQLSQPARLASLNSFKAGQKKILVATDVASRGLDIPAVDLVINYGCPKNGKDYVHRVGRTARAGRKGLAVTVACQYDVESFCRLEAMLGKKLDPLDTVSEADYKRQVDRVGEACRLVDTESRDRERGGGGAGKKSLHRQAKRAIKGGKKNRKTGR